MPCQLTLGKLHDFRGSADCHKHSFSNVTGHIKASLKMTSSREDSGACTADLCRDRRLAVVDNRIESRLGKHISDLICGIDGAGKD